MIDLSPWTPAVPDAVVERISSARRVLAVGHENPDADTIGSTLAVCRLVAACGGRGTPVFADPVPPLYEFVPDIATARTDPEPDADYDLLVVSDCGTLDRVGAVAGRHPELFARLPRVVLDHHASNDETGPADWVDPAAAATCEMTALLAARLGVPLDEGGGALAAQLMAGIVMDTATFAHPNSTPRTLAVSAALVEAGAPLSDISRRLYRSKPEAQLRLFGRRPRQARDRGRRQDRPLVAVRRGPRRDRRDPGPLRGDHRPARPGRRGRGRDRLQGSGRGNAAQRPDEARRRRRDRPDRRVRGRRPRPRRRSDDRGPGCRGRGPVLAEAERLVAALGR